MCKNAVEKFTFVIKYVPDQCKTKEIYEKVVIENCGMLGLITDCYKNQKMCDKAVGTYPTAMQLVSECYKSRKMCNKAVDTRTFIIYSVPDKYMTQIYDKVVSNKSSILIKLLVLINLYLLALEFVPDWLI